MAGQLLLQAMQHCRQRLLQLLQQGQHQQRHTTPQQLRSVVQGVLLLLPQHQPGQCRVLLRYTRPAKQWLQNHPHLRAAAAAACSPACSCHSLLHKLLLQPCHNLLCKLLLLPCHILMHQLLLLPCHILMHQLLLLPCHTLLYKLLLLPCHILLLQWLRCQEPGNCRLTLLLWPSPVLPSPQQATVAWALLLQRCIAQLLEASSETG
jgi:hypothetical protein